MTSTAKVLDVFICTTQNFRVGTFVTIASLIEHLSPAQETTIHLLSQSFSEDSLKYIEELIRDSGKPIRLEYKVIDLSVFSEIHEKQNGNYIRLFSEGIYGRLLIPTLFPKVKFGIYLDSDFLIQRDLSELAKLSESPTPLFAVTDHTVKTVSHQGDSIDCEKFNLNPNAPYFNSGFLVMNLQHWDREDLIPNCTRISRETNVQFPDQSLLNIIFTNKWESIDSKWNHMRLPEDWDFAFAKNNANYHFLGPLKPWIWPSRYAIGCIRKIHYYINKIPKEIIDDYSPIRKPYPLFFAKHHLR